MVGQLRGRETEGAGTHGVGQQGRDSGGLGRRCRTVDGLVAHDVIAKRRQRRQKGQVGRGAAAFGRRHELRKTLPIPGDALVQHVEGHALDVDQVMHRGVAPGRGARRDADPAVAHHHGGHAVPRRRRDHRVPADLRIVVGVRIDESRGDDQVSGVDGARGGATDPADLDNFSIGDGDVAVPRRAAAAIDENAVPDQKIECHRAPPSWMQGAHCASALLVHVY